MANNRAISILGIIALIAVIAAAIYYISNENDNDLEIDIGSLYDSVPHVIIA